MARPIGIDLFAGAGGMSLGFEQAGFDISAAVEIDPIHAAVHKFNFPRTAILARSVVGLSGAEIRKVANLEGKRIDVVFGGAPCQGFSLIGRRQLDDPRNALVKEFVRLVAELDAAYAVFENVKGLTIGLHRQMLEEMRGEFAGLGYEVVAPWKVLNAALFGVPQFRERLFLIAVKRGNKIPQYPIGSDGFTVSCRQALNDLPDADEFDELLIVDSVRAKYGRASRYASNLRCLSNDAWAYGYIREWNPSLLTSSLRTEHTEISKRRFSETAQGNVEPVSRFFKLPEDGVSNTLRAGTDSARGAFTSPRPIHYKFHRCITVREMMRLHGYPDWFRMHATKWHGARQVGNSVPPPLARAVAAKIVQALGVRPSTPKDPLCLGDPSILTFDMKECLALFGLECSPISQRNRRSTYKKRRQEEVERQIKAA